MAGSIFFVSAEPSGDLLSAEIVDEIRKTNPLIEIAGIGGEHLAERGIVSPIDVSELAIVGFVVLSIGKIFFSGIVSILSL